MELPQSPMSIESEIIEHYNSYDESQRLKNDIGPLEFERTRELILRFSPPPPSVILDVGGASGAYSFALAKLGYQVHLVDIVPRHIEQAKEASQSPESPQLASLQVGDARHLDFPDGFADVVLLFGPLYHLVDRPDRLQALAEAKRVLKPGGTLFAVAITRYAGLIYGLQRGYIFDPEYYRMVANEVQTGLRANPPAWLSTFSQAYFHLPEELKTEIQAPGLVHEQTLGILGPAWLVPDLDKSWQDPQQREVILNVSRMTENEPILGPRLLAVAHKPLA